MEDGYTLKLEDELGEVARMELSPDEMNMLEQDIKSAAGEVPDKEWDDKNLGLVNELIEVLEGNSE